MNILNIRPRELRLVIILILMFFCISAASITGSAVRDAVFLVKFERSYLPLMYIAIAIVMAFMIETYKNLISDRDALSLITNSGGIFALSLLVFHNNLNGWMIPLLYVWIEAITILMVLQFWMLAGELLNTRQAKRIFPIIIAGGSFAAIGSGYSIKPFVDIYGSDNLLTITIIFLFLSIIVGQFLRPYIGIINNSKERSEAVLQLQKVRLEPYLKYIAIMVACSAFISRVIDYQFKVMAVNAFPIQNELVNFFGTYYMVTGAATLLMQSVITGFILTRFGILAGLIFLPATLVFGAGGFLALGSMTAVFILKFSDQVFKFSMNNAVREILWLPLTSIKKNRSKPIIDGTIKSIVEGLAGLAIFLLVTFNLIPESKIYLLSLLVLALAIYWFWNSFRIKNGYLSEIMSSIENRQLNLDRVQFDLNDSSTVSALRSTLKDKDDYKKLFAIDLLWTLPLEPWKETIQNQFSIGSPEIKRGILELCWLKNDILTDQMVLDQIQLKDEISPYAISCASDRNISTLGSLIQIYIDSKNTALRSSTLVAIIKDDPDNSEVIKLINDILNNGNDKEVIGLLGLLIKSKYDIQENLVYTYLDSHNRNIKSGILKVIARNPKAQYIDPIIRLLDDKIVSVDAEKTLLNYNEDLICERLMRYFSDPASTNTIKIAILKIIHQFQDEHIIKMIISNMDDPDLNILNASCNALNRISKFHGLSKNELEQIEIVIKTISLRAFQLHLFRNALLTDPDAILLLDHIDSDLRVLGHLILKLGTLNDPNIPIESYLRYVDSKDPDLLPLVLELVDSTFSSNTIKLILPLIDPDMDPVAVAPVLLDKKILSKNEMLKFWVENPHHWKTNIALQFLLRSENTHILKKIKWDQLPEDLLEIRYFSIMEREYLNRNFINNNFTNKECNEMYSVLEKTLLLKSVDLFKTIPGDILSNIAQLAIEVQTGIDDIIFNEGDHGDSLYIIISGKVSVTRGGQSIAILGQGDCIGEMSLLDQEPRSAGALAVEDSILLKIDQKGFYELMSSNPDIMKQIVMMLTRRVREMNKKLTGSLS